MRELKWKFLQKLFRGIIRVPFSGHQDIFPNFMAEPLLQEGLKNSVFFDDQNEVGSGLNLQHILNGLWGDQKGLSVGV